MNSFLSPDTRQNTSTPTGRELGENEHRARSESLGTTLIVHVHFDEPVKKREGKLSYPVRQQGEVPTFLIVFIDLQTVFSKVLFKVEVFENSGFSLSRRRAVKI